MVILIIIIQVFMKENIMTDKEILSLIKEVLDINKEIELDTPLNIFEYDSLAKVSLIITIETYSSNRLDINEFLLCDTFQDLISLIKETRGK